MVRKLAIDWDDSELRLVAAQCTGRHVKITDAAVIPIVDNNVDQTLRDAIAERGLEKTETLVAIGRGKAELRELQLPPVPDEELPDMVRFQAIRSFASAGDSATVDFLVTKRSSDGVEMIVAAIGPADLQQIRQSCATADLEIKRISLRPLAAAALYLSQTRNQSQIPATGEHDTVLIDLLADDAEIVVARKNRVIFVRTVRMPADEQTRGKALAGELRRSLAACGSRGSLDQVILWGRESVHTDDREMLAIASESFVKMLDPFDLVQVETKAKAALPEHVGRLAPLVGLLVADETDADRLVDFLNPRKRAEEKPNPYRKAALIGVPLAAAALIGSLMYRQLSNLDTEIENLKAANAGMKANLQRANESARRTATVDAYLDGDVNWLAEIERLATSMPPSNQMIVRRIGGTVDDRRGGGTLTIVGGVTRPEVIDNFETAVRDPGHRVVGGGASEKQTADGYQWEFTESITIGAENIRQARYSALEAGGDDSVSASAETDSTAEEKMNGDQPAIDRSPPAGPVESDSPRGARSRLQAGRQFGGAGMNQRERLLAIAVGGLLAALVISWGWGKYRAAVNSRRQALTAQLEEQNRIYEQLIEGERANRYMGEYLIRSLPPDPEQARSDYQQWLLETVQASALELPNVSSNSSRSIGGLYQRLEFRVSGETDVPHFIELLHNFYSQDYLHRIRDFSLLPTKQGNFKLELSIDAIALLNASKEVTVPKGRSWRVDQELAGYRSTIMNRNLFEPPNQPPRYSGEAVVESLVGGDAPARLNFEDPDGHLIEYEFVEPPPTFVHLDKQNGALRVETLEKQEFEIQVRATDDGYPRQSTEQTLTIKVVDPPPEPEPAKPKPDFDDASQTVLTALVQGRDQWTAWMHVRTRGRTLRLKIGDQFEIGSLKGSVVDVNSEYAMLEIDGRQFKLEPAGNLSEAAKQPQP